MPDGSRSFPADGRFHRNDALHARPINSSAVAAVSLLLPILLLGGCGGGPYLMPTPNLYARGLKDPFPEVPPQLQSN